ncbi:type IV conjugative transfer system lipoprotein TraV [Methylosoma difficile]|jgi:conjugal transfer pilus assembly protein TraV
MKSMVDKFFKCLVLVFTVLMAGCSVFSLGKSDFSCPGGVDGVHCKSAREIYKATNNSDSVKPDNNLDASDRKTETIHVNASPVPVPTIEQPIPIRTQPQVMRIWVSPWEDNDGDLHADGFIYTEIEERKWNLGGRFKSPNSVISPLSTKNTATK